jgi:hypothetical protein
VRDYRKNFAAIVRFVDRWCATHPEADAIDIEAVTARTCQRKVAMHAWFALLEASRKHNPRRSRYQARVDGRPVTVWMHKWLTGRRRRGVVDMLPRTPMPLTIGHVTSAAYRSEFGQAQLVQSQMPGGGGSPSSIATRMADRA